MIKENKDVVLKWFTAIWSTDYNPNVIRELAAEDILFRYPLHGERTSSNEIIIMLDRLRASFPDLNFWTVGDLIAEGDYVVGRWDGGGTHTGEPFSDLPLGEVKAANTGAQIRFTGTSVFKVINGKIKEDVGQEEALNVLQQVGIVPLSKL